jgi:hypothetical protein
MLTGGLRERIRLMVMQVRPEATPTDAVLHADLLVSIIFGLAEAFLDERVDDLDHAASVASRAIIASILSDKGVADAA